MNKILNDLKKKHFKKIEDLLLLNSELNKGIENSALAKENTDFTEGFVFGLDWAISEILLIQSNEKKLKQEI